MHGSLFQRSDSSTADFRDAPPVCNNGKPNVFSVAKNQYAETDQAYDGIRNPYVLVINNVNFHKDPRPRNGASHDRDNVRRFLDEAGFRSVEHFDLRKNEMMDILELTRQNGALGEFTSEAYLTEGNVHKLLSREPNFR